MNVKRPILSPDAWRLIGLIVAPFVLTGAVVWLNVVLLGPDRAHQLFFDAHYTLTRLPMYDPMLIHQGDVLATFAIAVFFLFAAGSVLLGSSLFLLFCLGNLTKIYVLREHFVHHDFFLIPQLWKGVDWSARIGLVCLFIAVAFLVYRTFCLRLVKIRLVVVMSIVLVGAYSLNIATDTINMLLQDRWIHRANRDPYGMILYNGPVMSILVYELNYRRLLQVMSSAPDKPPAKPEGDFRAVPPKAVVDKPNIYILMLESYLDPYYFHKVQFNIPPISGILADEIGKHDTTAFYTIRATAAAEFEVLCGLPNQQAYADKIFDFLLKPDESLNCLPRYLKGLGYTTIASHPNVSSMYNRGNAYPILGFEKIYFSPDLDMSDKDSIWLNDKSFLDQNLEMVKKQLKTHQPFLNYVMTVGGHYPYQLAAKRPPMLRGTPTLNDTLAGESLQLSYYTARAVSDYLGELRKLDPGALIIIMGDHFPYVINDDDALITWEKKHENTAEPSFTPVHHLYNLEHQTFGIMLYKNHILPQPYFEQFEVSDILTNILTRGKWCQQHHCAQQQPYMLIGPDIMDRKDPVRNYCAADKTAVAKAQKGKTSACQAAKKLEGEYLLLYQQMFYPFFN